MRHLGNNFSYLWALLIIFIFIVIFFTSGCASPPKTTAVDVEWAFCEVIPSENWACLREDDVKKLRQALIECQNRK